MLTRKKWSKDEIEIMNQYYPEMGAKYCADILNRTTASVKRYAERHDIRSARSWSDEEINFLIDNYKEYTYAELGKILGRSKISIDQKVSDLGLVKSKYTFNKRFFETIDTEEKAYWCGFIMADGNVYIDRNNSGCVSINLNAGDHDHLRKFNKSLCGNVPVTFYQTTINDKTYKLCSIRFYSVKMCDDLIQHNVIPNKSLIKEFPNDIPGHLLCHYIRGYFDGNGSIVERNDKKGSSFLSICTGSIKFAESLNTFINDLGIKTTGAYKDSFHDNDYYIRIFDQFSVKKLLDYMYHDSNISLERKYYKYLKVIKRLNDCFDR